jgi:TetR/AcrR family fatty acid metabolism transcriptional regulator
MVSRMRRPLLVNRGDVTSVLKKRVVKSAEERREEILEASLTLFAQKGFNETTVDDIAAAAGVAKGTIYLYFPSKEHILMALKQQFQKGLEMRCADVITDAIERLAAGEELDYRRIIDDIFDAILQYNVEHRETIEVAIRQTTGPGLITEALDLEKGYLQLLATAFREATEHGLIHTSDPEMMACLVNAAIRDNIVTCLCYEKPCDLSRMVAAAKELVYKALAPLPGGGPTDAARPRPRLVHSDRDA